MSILPPRSRPLARLLTAVGGMAVLAALSCAWLDLWPWHLFSTDALAALQSFVDRVLPPSTDSPILRRAQKGVVETLAISIVGTVLGALAGLCLAPLCCRSILVGDRIMGEMRSAGIVWRTLRVSLHWTARMLANVLRTIPYFVWAILFWFMLGPGPFPGALAIALHSAGVFARLYSGSLDQVPPEPLESLQSCGARPSQVFTFGMLPAALPNLLSYTLYRWEVNLRESAVLGIIGEVGIGYHITYAFGTFDFHAVGTYLLGVMVLVLAVDAISAILRRRIV